MGVSVRTVYKWVKRWKQQGKEGLEDRSSRPHRCPRGLPRHRRRQIERLRQRRRSTPRIARELKIPLSTVAVTPVRGGEIVAAASEERFTRKKGDAGFPAKLEQLLGKKEVEIAYLESPIG